MIINAGNPHAFRTDQGEQRLMPFVQTRVNRDARGEQGKNCLGCHEVNMSEHTKVAHGGLCRKDTFMYEGTLRWHIGGLCRKDHFISFHV